MENEIVLKEVNGKVMASSRDIAERFEKDHKHVLRDIKNLIDQNWTVKNMFTETEYISDRGRKYPEYEMNRDGFSLLVMGFTGKEALEWKLKYIDAFNKMEELLKSQNKALPTTYKEALIQLLETIEKNEQLEAERQVLLPKVTYHDTVLNKEGLITTTIIAKDLGLTSAAKLNQIMYLNRVIYKKADGSWCPYAEYEWLITEEYADYKSYEKEHSKPCLKWTEKGRQWIIEQYIEWCKKVA